MARVALITGIAGQDGHYLSELLTSKGYDVYGIEPPGRRVSAGLCRQLLYADIAEASNLGDILDEIRPDEVYNLAGLSRVSASFEDPVNFARVNGLGTVRLLDAVRRYRDRRYRDRSYRDIRFYQASSTEMFGSTDTASRNESTPFHPRSPYAVSKIFAHLQTVNYREAFGLFACCGILSNHESPRRDEHFVTRKITATAARIKLGLAEKLCLGNLDVRRDWGFAGDFVEAMWRMLQHERPDDYVIATGETHSVREFVEEVFSYLGLDWARHVKIDPKFFRPADIESMHCDSSKAHQILGWRPRVTFQALARMMADHDLELARQTRP